MRHALVIADHNGAFKSNAESRVRFTQAGAVLKEDSISRVASHARVQTASLELASGDHRTLQLCPQQQTGQNLPQSLSHLSAADLPGAYAYDAGYGVGKMGEAAGEWGANKINEGFFK